MPPVTLSDITTTAVIGAGEMGRGIAAVQALAGFEVWLQDIDADQRKSAREHINWSYGKAVDNGQITESDRAAALERLSITESVQTAVGDADFVTEAVAEQQSIKQDVFETLDSAAPDQAILATNTSGLNITDLAETTERPKQVVGTHWFNPPMLMDLVEVIMTEYTPDSIASTCESFVDALGKTPIRCKRDIPLFIVNRLMRPYGEAAAWLVYYEEAGIEEIDSAMKYREEFPMGPFELADYTGGIQLRVESETDHLHDSRPLAYDTRYCPLLHEKYENGHYGRKTGQGFYNYQAQDEPSIAEAAGAAFDTDLVWAPVINEAAKLVQHDVASVTDIDTGAKLGGNWPSGPLEHADVLGLDHVVATCTNIAAMHGTNDELTMLAETLPCELLVTMAKSGDSFYPGSS